MGDGWYLPCTVQGVGLEGERVRVVMARGGGDVGEGGVGDRGGGEGDGWYLPCTVWGVGLMVWVMGGTYPVLSGV